jgi:hypothetical protein
MRYDLIHRKAVVVTVSVLLLTLGALSATPSAMAAGHSVTNVSFKPSTPNILVNNKDVSISFSYATTQVGGVRIHVRPFVGNALAPNYAASGSPLYPTGAGTGTGTFTIKTGTVTVDRVRIQMWNANQTTLLFEAFLPVHFQFRAP